MANIILPSDTANTGKAVRTLLLPNGEHLQQFGIADALGTAVGVRADGFLNVRSDPTTLLFDTFETVDTTNTWTLSGTVPPSSNAAGQVTASAGTAANAYSFARSQPTFQPGSSAFLQYGSLVQIEAAVLTGSTRWWGLGVPNSTPTTGVPVLNGSVFEVRAADGALYGSVYSNGVLTQSVALIRPTDGAVHRYQILYKASRVYFNIDNVEVGTLPFPNPTVAALPVSFGSVNGGAALGTAPVLNLTLVGVADTAANEIRISDGVYPWRKATVRADGTLNVNIGGSAGSAAATTGTFTNVVNSAVTANVSTAGNATISLVGGTYTGLPIIFEASADGGTTWFTIDATQADGTGINTGLTLPASGGPRNWNIMCPGYTHVRVRLTGTAATFTTSPTVNIVQGPFLYDPSPTIQPIDGQKWSYTGNMNPAGAAGIANALDQWVLQNPTASTRTIRVTRLAFQVTLATAAVAYVQLAKRSAFNTGGTIAAGGANRHDTASPLSVVTAQGVYTAAPTASGAIIGVYRTLRLSIPAATAPGALQEFYFGNRPAQAITLRPGEQLSLFGGATPSTAFATAPTFTGEVEWTEE